MYRVRNLILLFDCSDIRHPEHTHTHTRTRTPTRTHDARARASQTAK